MGDWTTVFPVFLDGCSYKESEDEDEDQCLYPAKKILMKEEGGDECPETLEKPCPRKAKKAGKQKAIYTQNLRGGMEGGNGVTVLVHNVSQMVCNFFVHYI